MFDESLSNLTLVTRNKEVPQLSYLKYDIMWYDHPKI